MRAGRLLLIGAAVGDDVASTASANRSEVVEVPDRGGRRFDPRSGRLLIMRHSSLDPRSLVLSVLASCLVTLGTGPAPAAAQDWRPEKGDRSIAFGIPAIVLGGLNETGGGLELWWQRSDRSAVGLALDMGFGGHTSTDDVGSDRTSKGFSIAVGPALKRYGEPVGPVSPFLYGALGIGGSRSTGSVDDPDIPDRIHWGADASASLGIGVDWFPLDRISVGGHTGGVARYGFRGESHTPDRSTRSWGFRLFTTRLKVQLYF